MVLVDHRNIIGYYMFEFLHQLKQESVKELLSYTNNVVFFPFFPYSFRSDWKELFGLKWW